MRTGRMQFKIGDVIQRICKSYVYDGNGNLVSEYRSPLDGPVKITEFTEGGFKYKHPRINLGSRIGWTEGGETFEPDGYELVKGYQLDLFEDQ
jgi:hypothetical protein